MWRSRRLRHILYGSPAIQIRDADSRWAQESVRGWKNVPEPVRLPRNLRAAPTALCIAARLPTRPRSLKNRRTAWLLHDLPTDPPSLRLLGQVLTGVPASVDTVSDIWVSLVLWRDLLYRL